MQNVALIPSYEPDERLIKIIKELKESKFEVVLVNDGSNKSYDKIFNQCKDMCTYLSYKVNQGKGYALKTGLKYINENYKDTVVITMDSDGQHTVKDAKNLCKIVSKKDNTILLGCRLRGEKTPLRSKFGNAVSRWFYRTVTGIDVYDTQTGLRAFKQDMIPFLLKVEGNRFEYEMNMLLDSPKNKIKLEEEVIETIYEDNNSGSHFNTFRDSYLIYKEVVKFILSSIGTYVIDMGSFIALNIFTGNIIISNLLGRIITSPVSYLINRKVVFNSKEKLSKTIIRYSLLAIVILAINTGLLFLATKIGINVYVAKVILDIIPFLVNYRVQKNHIF